jgi:hypothetical protein
MTRYINLFLLGFICLWLNRAASTDDKRAVRNGINFLFNEPKADNYVDVASLPVAYVIANTNITGWFLVIDERQLENLKVDLNKVTVAKLNAWRDNNLDNPNHLKWARGESWEQVLADNGLAIYTNQAEAIP